MAGGEGDDVQRGGDGNDRIFANRGVDESFGGEGNDRLWAMARRDVDTSAGPDTNGDTLHGELGNDRFHTRDGEQDVIDCGAGEDVVQADTVDVVTTDCETVKRAEPKPRRDRRESSD
jgi:Ca2+-binding RTX toxin-like protein